MNKLIYNMCCMNGYCNCPYYYILQNFIINTLKKLNYTK